MRGKSIANLIIAGVVFANVVLNMFHINPIPLDEDAVYQAVSLLAMGADSVWLWWKNMPVTDKAIEAQEKLNVAKKVEDIADEFYEEEGVE